jgi:hypothetical protein
MMSCPKVCHLPMSIMSQLSLKKQGNFCLDLKIVEKRVKFHVISYERVNYKVKNNQFMSIMSEKLS